MSQRLGGGHGPVVAVFALILGLGTLPIPAGAADVIGGERFAVHASLIEADANKQRSVPGDVWNVTDLPTKAGQAAKGYLATLDHAAFGAASDEVRRVCWGDRLNRHLIPDKICT
jgi:hypothetical protein